MRSIIFYAVGVLLLLEIQTPRFKTRLDRAHCWR